MTRFRRLASLGLLSCVVTVLLPSTAYAGGRSTHTYVLTETASYQCIGDCATAAHFVAWGTATSTGLGDVDEALFGTVLGFNHDMTCLLQAETWVISTSVGDLFLNTTSDTFCFTADPNVNIETGQLRITGGTGRFAHSKGGGSFVETVLGSPQTATGTITLNVKHSPNARSGRAGDRSDDVEHSGDAGQCHAHPRKRRARCLEAIAEGGRGHQQRPARPERSQQNDADDARD